MKKTVSVFLVSFLCLFCFSQHEASAWPWHIYSGWWAGLQGQYQEYDRGGAFIAPSTLFNIVTPSETAGVRVNL